MKTNCDIIQDLLPLYCDNVCSEESKCAVEDHIQECEQCRNDLMQMQREIKEETPKLDEKKVAKSAKSAWNKKKLIAFVAGCLAIMLIASIAVGAVFAYHAFNSADADDYNSLRAQVESCSGCQIQSIKEVEIRGNYLATLCKDDNGDWRLCMFERDILLRDRWVAMGSRKTKEGKLGSYNYGDSEGNAVIIIFGANIPSEVKSYEITNSGITYICPANTFILDIFVIPDANDISSTPHALDANGEEIPGYLN